ncbi:hypothetical protein Syun_001629 [Stephania yunnanensis]|uniref:Uncharacterized protein n=1 Tax=Stephania yunnanensis TaxID=152371 RepID=A0AAP0LJV4_9MAGN
MAKRDPRSRFGWRPLLSPTHPRTNPPCLSPPPPVSPPPTPCTNPPPPPRLSPTHPRTNPSPRPPLRRICVLAAIAPAPAASCLLPASPLSLTRQPPLSAPAAPLPLRCSPLPLLAALPPLRRRSRSLATAAVASLEKGNEQVVKLGDKGKASGRQERERWWRLRSGGGRREWSVVAGSGSGGGGGQRWQGPKQRQGREVGFVQGGVGERDGEVCAGGGWGRDRGDPPFCAKRDLRSRFAIRAILAHLAG